MNAPGTDSRMHQTMQRQPADLERLLNAGWKQARQAVDLIGAAGRITLIGIGSSYHAALVGAWLLREAGANARAVSSFDFARYPSQYPLGVNDAVILLSHTGVRRFSVEALDRANASGATVISIGSQSVTHPGSLLTLRTVERETSAAYTSSHLAAMTVLAQVATDLGQRRGVEQVAHFPGALSALPDLVRDALTRDTDIDPIARYAVEHRVFAAGAGPNEATALEAVIKVREAARGNIDALPAEQFLHGPMVAFNAGDLLVMVNVQGNSTDRTAAISAVGAAMGGKLWIVGEAIDLQAATTFALPTLPEALAPLLTVVPMQMLARQMAALKGLNPDAFRCDDERYKNAFGLLKL